MKVSNGSNQYQRSFFQVRDRNWAHHVGPTTLPLQAEFIEVRAEGGLLNIHTTVQKTSGYLVPLPPGNNELVSGSPTFPIPALAPNIVILALDSLSRANFHRLESHHFCPDLFLGSCLQLLPFFEPLIGGRPIERFCLGFSTVMKDTRLLI